MMRQVVRLATISVVLLCASGALGQLPDQFGVRSRADAAKRMIVLGVQQGISSLPPTSGQSFRYVYDKELKTSTPTRELGPGAFRSATTVGKGNFSVRVAGSYFELSERFDPVEYLVEFDEAPPGFPEAPSGVSAFGLDANARVGLLNVGVSGGLAERFELMFNIPLTIVDANTGQISPVAAEDVNLPVGMAQGAGFFGPSPLPTDPQLRADEIDFLRSGFRDRLVDESGNCRDPNGECVAFRTDSFDSLGQDLKDGTEVGLGRISLGGKYTVLDGEAFKLAASTEFFFASPNEDEFAGSESYSILPRLIAEAPLTMMPGGARAHIDLGYEHDFSEAELRRLVWNAGVSVPVDRFTFDVGVGGSRFDQAIRFSPATAKGVLGDTPISLTALEDTGIGVDFVDFIGGIKIRALDRLVVTGVVNVPLNGDGFRADAVGTIGAEYYF